MYLSINRFTDCFLKMGFSGKIKNKFFKIYLNGGKCVSLQLNDYGLSMRLKKKNTCM